MQIILLVTCTFCSVLSLSIGVAMNAEIAAAAAKQLQETLE